MKRAAKVVSTVALLSFAGTAMAADSCGKVTIADMNWNSGTLIAHVDQFILTHGYGCDAELIPGDTVPTGTSMIEKGEPDIAPEFWSNGMKEALDKGVQEKRLRYVGKALSESGEEGFWVPKYLVDKKPELATIEGVIKNASMFKHPENPKLSGFYGCPAGWACQITSGNLFKALKLEDKGFELLDPGSSAGLSGSLARAYDRKKPWFGYYWAPTAILGKYDMVKVDFGTGVVNEHMSCISKVDCENPKVTMYAPAPALTVTTEKFAARAPEAIGYLSRRSFTNAEMNGLLAWMEEEQADGEIVMEHFLKTYPQLWQAWVPGPVAEKVKKSLSQL